MGLSAAEAACWEKWQRNGWAIRQIGKGVLGRPQQPLTHLARNHAAGRCWQGLPAASRVEEGCSSHSAEMEQCSE